MENCCNRCFDNEFIIKLIKDKMEIGSCDYCGSKGVYLCDMEVVGEFIRERLKIAYENINDEGRYHIVRQYVFDVLRDTEAIFSDHLLVKGKVRDLFDDLMKSSRPDRGDITEGDRDYFEGGEAKIVLRGFMDGSDYSSFSSAWDAFQHQCKLFGCHFEFGHEAKTRKGVFKVMADLFQQQSLNKTLTSESVIWSARPSNSNFELPENPLDILKEAGPPPAGVVKNNRLSPAGVSYFYGAEKPETCMAEIKPSLGEKILLCKFGITQDLAILDLTLIPDIQIRSIFDPGYDHEMLWAKQLMSCFLDEIRKPMTSEDSEIDYVPTQVLAEFIRKEGYQGIKYENSQRSGEYNYTLFFGPFVEMNRDYRDYDSIQPFSEVMTLIRTQIIDLS